MKDFFKAQLDEIRENKIRIGLLVACLVFAIVYAIVNSMETGEEISLDAPQKISQVTPPNENISLTPKSISVTADKVKAVIGANADEIYIYDPFQNPTPPKVDELPPPVTVEEKVLPPTEPVIIVQPVEEMPAPPAENFILRGTAIVSENKTALVEKISAGKIETLFLKIGDEVSGKKIVDIKADSLTLEDGETLEIKD